MSLVVAIVHPDLLGTYGDGGNGVVLARRAAWRGVDVELVDAPSGSPLPTADIYTLGGGEDGPQGRSAAALIDDGTILRAHGHGAVVLAVCAGYQICGRTFPDAGGRLRDGLGLLDVTTTRGAGRRAVGELLAEPSLPGCPPLTGFENHAGITALGPRARPLGKVVTGVGNGTGDGTEGAVTERVVGTYLHGPVLARNPGLADLLLGWAVGSALAPLDDSQEEALRNERMAASGPGRSVRRWALRRRR
ncbi:MAG: type 1 glutamine amidotransferase [Acidimicrobiales bacterium]